MTELKMISLEECHGDQALLDKITDMLGDAYNEGGDAALFGCPYCPPDMRIYEIKGAMKLMKKKIKKLKKEAESYND